MQTELAEFSKHTVAGQQAAEIIRSCVHCGFCNATCPTYQLSGDELDGPRGRIYLIKNLLEGTPATMATQQHLARCLTCLGCETTCPSAVQFRRLLDTGREIVAAQLVNPLWSQRLLTYVLLKILPYTQRFAFVIKLVRCLKPGLPERLKSKIPLKQVAVAWPSRSHERRMLLLQGCVQPELAPRINLAAANVLDALGISVIPIADCCGGLDYHLSHTAAALTKMRRIIDACWPYVQEGVEAIVSTASGCGITVKDYGFLLKADPDYAAKAAQISSLTKDIAEILQSENLTALNLPTTKLAFHAPCTLQHGQQLPGVVESLLTSLGFTLCEVTDSHLCCGAAGTYSIFQAEIAEQLQQAKLQALQNDEPALIATANIGCWLHLQAKANVPVVHWIELLMP